MSERYDERFSADKSAPFGVFEFVSLNESGNHLSVVVEGDDGALTLRFSAPTAYRVIDEGLRLRQRGLRQPEASLEGEPCALLYIVDDSVFLAELARLSDGALEGQSLTHFVIWTLNQCVDVVAARGPSVGGAEVSGPTRETP